MAAPAPLPPRQCEVCKTQENLVFCGACKVVSYCGPAHQESDRDVHDAQCKVVEISQRTLDEEEARLRDLPGNWQSPENIFENGVGNFWRIITTRNYMDYRLQLIVALLDIHTVEAVQVALAHIMDMFRLSRCDYIHLRDRAPSVMLRLNMDQECYDFIKWWITRGIKHDYDCTDMTLPYLDVKGANPFEPCDVFLVDFEFTQLGLLVAVTLLKTKLLIDLQWLQNTRGIGSTALPMEIVDLVRGNAVSPVFQNYPEVFHTVDQRPRIRDMESQVLALYTCVEKANRYFWSALRCPGDNLAARPAHGTAGDVTEMQITLQETYAAWNETPGAIDAILALASRGI
ncbi:hypothetical protein GQ53DRAFT_719733 [Thozetella sp. PMI_491]|nr:hypothetical protein GQ53DRAFT_719733 [Thozetella sp. PMI_491]